LNAGSDHYGEDRVRAVEIKIDKRGGKPIGTFRCECGFVYTRKGPDRGPEDRMRRSRIKEFGPVWTQKLHRLVEQNLSQREIARLLGVDTKTVVGQLRKRSEIVNPGADDESLQHLQRVRWLTLVSENPGLSRTELRRRCPAVYTWLRRNDPHWLQSHLPPVKRGPGSQRRVDWDARDQRLVALIEKAAVELTGREGKPIRLSAGAILTAAGVKGLVEKHQDKLPKTVAVLQQVQESRESFAIRRLRWSADLLTREKGTYAEWELLRRAGVSRELASAPAVAKALAAILDSPSEVGGNAAASSTHNGQGNQKVIS